MTPSKNAGDCFASIQIRNIPIFSDFARNDSLFLDFSGNNAYSTFDTRTDSLFDSCGNNVRLMWLPSMNNYTKSALLLQEGFSFALPACIPAKKNPNHGVGIFLPINTLSFKQTAQQTAEHIAAAFAFQQKAGHIVQNATIAVGIQQAGNAG